ncbi:MAG TPA: YggT family protein [Pedomonas sp.]|uniref:YggT family protein n=1 Tax=Pedomonas sp. TaxID=2976421 RepID=UPI002F3F0BDC
MNAFVWLIAAILNLLLYAIIISAVASWLIAFNVINPYNNFVRTVLHALNRIVEPLCRPVRRVLPDLGGVDLSPLVVGLGIMFLLRLLRDFFPGAFM